MLQRLKTRLSCLLNRESGASVVGVDISYEMLALGRNKLEGFCDSGALRLPNHNFVYEKWSTIKDIVFSIENGYPVNRKVGISD